MGSTIRRIQQIATEDFSKLNPGQIGYTTSADDVLGKRVFGGKNDQNEVSIFLEKDQNARLKNTTISVVSLAQGVSQSPLNIVSNFDHNGQSGYGHMDVILSATTVDGNFGDFSPGIGQLFSPHELTIKHSMPGGYNSNGMFQIKTANVNQPQPPDIYTPNTISTITMVSDRVIINKFDDDANTGPSNLASSTFSCLCVVFDSRNSTYGYDPITPTTYWWNLGTVSNSDFVLQSSCYAWGEGGQFRLTSAGGLTVGRYGYPSNEPYLSAGGSGTFIRCSGDSSWGVAITSAGSLSLNCGSSATTNPYLSASNNSVTWAPIGVVSDGTSASMGVGGFGMGIVLSASPSNTHLNFYNTWNDYNNSGSQPGITGNGPNLYLHDARNTLEMLHTGEVRYETYEGATFRMLPRVGGFFSDYINHETGYQVYSHANYGVFRAGEADPPSDCYTTFVAGRGSSTYGYSLSGVSKTADFGVFGTNIPEGTTYNISGVPHSHSDAYTLTTLPIVADSNDIVIVGEGAGNGTLTLPATNAMGNQIAMNVKIKSLKSGTLTVNCDGSNIYYPSGSSTSASSFNLAYGENIYIVSNGGIGSGGYWMSF